MDNQLHAMPGVQRGFMPKSRVAVSLLFLMNGFLVGCWHRKFRNLPKGSASANSSSV